MPTLNKGINEPYQTIYNLKPGTVTGDENFMKVDDHGNIYAVVVDSEETSSLEHKVFSYNVSGDVSEIKAYHADLVSGIATFQTFFYNSDDNVSEIIEALGNI